MSEAVESFSWARPVPQAVRPAPPAALAIVRAVHATVSIIAEQLEFECLGRTQGPFLGMSEVILRAAGISCPRLPTWTRDFMPLAITVSWNFARNPTCAAEIGSGDRGQFGAKVIQVT